MARGFSRPHLPAAEASAFSPSAPWARSLLGRRPPPASFTAAFRLGPVGGRAALSGLPAAERRAPCASRFSPECAASCPRLPAFARSQCCLPLPSFHFIHANLPDKCSSRLFASHLSSYGKRRWFLVQRGRPLGPCDGLHHVSACSQGFIKFAKVGN